MQDLSAEGGHGFWIWTCSEEKLRGPLGVRPQLFLAVLKPQPRPEPVCLSPPVCEHSSGAPAPRESEEVLTAAFSPEPTLFWPPQGWDATPRCPQGLPLLSQGSHGLPQTSTLEAAWGRGSRGLWRMEEGREHGETGKHGRLKVDPGP